MARFGLVGPAYRSQSLMADCETLMNLYLEMIESGQGKGAAALYCTPGLLLQYNLGQAGVRGIITAQQRTFCVAGTVLWELLAPTANPNKINRGAVISDGQPVSMASGPTQVLIASAGNLYVFQLVAGTTTNIGGAILPANSLTQIPNYNNSTGFGLLQPSVAQVVYGDGFFFALFSNSNQIQASNPLDGSSWNGLSQTAVSVFSDNVLAIFVNARRLWVFGPNNIQPYFDSGNFPFPYDVDQSALIEQGIAAPASVAKLDNSFFWLGSSLGSAIVWRMNGYTPTRVSTHALEYELGTYATIADCIAFAYVLQGHTFYKMLFPTAQKCWVYDVATSSWHEEGYWNQQAGKFTLSRAAFHTSNFGMHLVGDPTTGIVYQQSPNFLNDAGNPIRRLRRAPHISNEQGRIIHTELQIDLEVGQQTFQGAAPPLIIPVLDSGGALRNFQMGENGVLEAPLAAGGDVSTAQQIFLNDELNTTSWQITVSAFGVIQAVQLAKYIDSYPLVIPFVTTLGDQMYNLQLNNLGGGNAILQTAPIGIVGRGPEIILRWSNDGAQTFTDPGRVLDCGQTGATLTRVIARQLGSARDRVYEISMTDPVPWRIVDAYLFTDPEDKAPTSRFATEARKRA